MIQRAKTLLGRHNEAMSHAYHSTDAVLRQQADELAEAEQLWRQASQDAPHRLTANEYFVIIYSLTSY